MTGTLDLGASWLIAAYVLVALLGVHGILFDRWTKRVATTFHAANAIELGRMEGLPHARVPLYLLSAMALLVVVIVFVMVTKLSFLS